MDGSRVGYGAEIVSQAAGVTVSVMSARVCVCVRVSVRVRCQRVSSAQSVRALLMNY